MALPFGLQTIIAIVKSSPKSGRSINYTLTKIRLSILGQGFECMSHNLQNLKKLFFFYKHQVQNNRLTFSDLAARGPESTLFYITTVFVTVCCKYDFSNS